MTAITSTPTDPTEARRAYAGKAYVARTANGNLLAVPSVKTAKECARAALTLRKALASNAVTVSVAS